MFKIQKKLRAWQRSEAQHCSSLCSQSEGNEYCGGQTRLKIQRRYALKRWLYSLRVRGPHFASKVSYNAGAATDDYVGQCKTPLRGRCRLFANLIFMDFEHPTFQGQCRNPFARLRRSVLLAAAIRATRGRRSCYSRPRVDDIVKVFKIQKKLCASPQQTIMRASAILRCEGAGAFQYY